MGLFNTTRNLVSLWAKNKKRKLQESGTPNSKVDSGGTIDKNPFQTQAVDRGELRDVKEIRESGGVVSHLVHAKALMQFGTGIQFEADDEEIAEWLEETFNDIDNLLISLGEDAIWYPYSLAEIVETQAGGFSHVECIEPWTMEPKTNEFGEVVMWEQEISGDYGKNVERFDPDEVASFVLNKSSGRDKTGISEVLRAEQEIEGYRQNAHAINNAIDFASYVRRHVKVGREDGGIIDDNELRRVRNRVDNLKEDTTLVTGPHVEFDTLGGNDFDFSAITEHDLRKLALALGLPLELANVGSDGLGSGMPAKLRLTLFERQARAAQRALADQFVQQIIRPVLEEYSPYPSDANVEVVFGDPVEEEDRNLSDMAPYLTLDEIRQKLDKPPAEDEELGKSYRKPANIQAPDEEEPEDGGIGGLFSDELESALDDRTLAEIPDKYIEETGLSEDDFVPNESILTVIDPTLEFIDEHGLPNPDDQREGAARINQLKDHIENNEPLAAEFWQEILNFHKRHRAQNNDECDESSLPEEATEIDNSQFDKCHFDNGWFSDRTWGGDPAFEQAQKVVNAIESTEGVDLSRANTASIWHSGDGSGNGHSVPEWDEHFLSLHRRIFESDSSRNLIQFNQSETPEFVKERLKDAIRSGAVFSEFADIPSGELMQLREFLTEELEDERWNIDGIANRIQDLEGADLSFEQAQTIARTETASTVNTAREIGYEERGLGDAKFYWTGVLDDRVTQACEWLIKQTNPNEGGTPVPLDELKQLIDEAPSHDPEMDDNLARPDNYVVHPNERKTFVRHVE